MSSFSDFLENELLDTAFNAATYTGPATIYTALFTVNPTDSGGGTEVTGGGYARQTVDFGTASGGAIANITAATSWTASGANYGTVTGMALFHASAAGNMLAWDAISSAVVDDGDTIQFPVGDIDITLD